MTNEDRILDILTGMSLRLDGMDKRFDAVDARFDAVDARFDAVDARFDAVDSRLDAVDARFDAVDARLDAVDARFDAVDVRLDAVDARFDAVENAVLKTNIKIETDLEVKLDALADGHAAILEQLTPRSRIDDIETELAFLKRLVASMGAEIDKLKAV